uniref:Uncharacterized protein n=1 Tax=Nelumbo nucifera TaxID=4432 RepID=A0A822YHD1_NELNU|nr:TPA_asm: hypothetical protein HUJ06_009187 [Nelumbo nucifera]
MWSRCLHSIVRKTILSKALMMIYCSHFFYHATCFAKGVRYRRGSSLHWILTDAHVRLELEKCALHVRGPYGIARRPFLLSYLQPVPQ